MSGYLVMGTYRILYPVGGSLNHECARGVFEYEDICGIECGSLDGAFLLGQNDLSDRYSSLNKRSTSVGDIIVDPNGTHYFVMGMGFQEIPPSVARYIDWGNH
jgi:hypothetical protein